MGGRFFFFFQLESLLSFSSSFLLFTPLVMFQVKSNTEFDYVFN